MEAPCCDIIARPHLMSEFTKISAIYSMSMNFTFWVVVHVIFDHITGFCAEIVCGQNYKDEYEEESHFFLF